MKYGNEGFVIDTLTLERFRTWSLIREGESKEIRQHPDDPSKVVIWLKPSIYSYTENRCGWIEGSNLLRARCMKTLIPLLKAAGIDHAYQEISDKTGFIVARKIQPHEDPNVEVIVKRYNGGTSYHKYFGLDKRPARLGHPFWAGVTVGKMQAYPAPKVRFDWRNPFFNPDKVASLQKLDPLLPLEPYKWSADLRAKVMMQDEVLGEDFAEDLLDVKAARRTALWTYAVLQRYLARCDIVIYDMCLFITADGKTVYGEVNQDCGRFRHLDLGHLDKDVWRSGGSSQDVLDKWQLLVNMIENPRPERT
jgi:hypothetical protein